MHLVIRKNLPIFAEKIDEMRKLACMFSFLLMVAGCVKQSAQEVPVSDMEVSGQVHEPVIEEVCRDAASDVLTPEEIAHWDSMNANGGRLLIRGAERNLDTIVNHLRIVFITDP